MVKKISILALAGMIALPAVASAGASAVDLERKIDSLTQELQMLKRQMDDLKATTVQPAKETVSPREIQQLKGEMADLQTNTDNAITSLQEQAEGWDTAARFKLFGDFRTRIDYVTADTPAYFSALDFKDGSLGGVGAGFVPFINAQPSLAAVAGSFDSVGSMLTALQPSMADDLATWRTAAAGMGITDSGQQEALFYMFTNLEVGGMLTAMAAMPATTVTDAMETPETLAGFMKNLSPAARAAIFANMGYGANPATTYKNDSVLTNRFRLNMRVKAMENLEFKGRLAMYKAWGMENNPVDYTLMGGPFMLSSLSFDGNRSRIPTNNNLVVDRAILNWNNVGGQPVWISIGRRPTTDGPPSHIRQGLDKRQATPAGFMDYAFDGFTLGYAYANPWPGRIRFCAGRGFESGPTENGDGLTDTNFAGISWDIYHKGSRFLYFQSFGAFDMFNVPDDVTFPNPIEFANWQSDPGAFNPLDPDKNLVLDRKNLGDIYHTAAVYLDKWTNLHYFLNLGWSRTNPSGVDELGTGLLSSWWDDPRSENGYSVYAGIRYDYTDLGLKLGLEYNYGTEYWISFTPAHDDLYRSKLAARGQVAEAYLIWDIPAGEAISKYAKAFMRFGYQHYKYNYTGSGYWLGAPVDIDDLANDPLNAQFYTPVDNMDQLYLTFEAYF